MTPALTRGLDPSLSPSTNQKVMFVLCLHRFGIKRRHFWTFGFVTTILQLQITEGLSALPWKSPLVLTGDFDPHLCANKGKNQAYIIEIGCMKSFSAVCCEKRT